MVGSAGTPGTAPGHSGAATVAVVLTGGRSSRMGTHKPALDVGGRTVVDRVVAAVAPWPVVVVGRGEGVPTGTRVVADTQPDAGPVAALATALPYVLGSTADVVVVLAGDLPLVSHEHLERLREHALETPPSPAVTADPDGRLNWLCAAWPTALLADRLRALVEGDGVVGRSVRSLVGDLEVRPVPHDGDVVDVDTPADLAAARALLSEVSRSDLLQPQQDSRPGDDAESGSASADR
jgi:molybdopterin-guanine dinucleotide biosynthesis protein A